MERNCFFPSSGLGHISTRFRQLRPDRWRPVGPFHSIAYESQGALLVDPHPIGERTGFNLEREDLVGLAQSV